MRSPARISLLLAISFLAGCDTFSDMTAWLGSDDDKKPLSGARVAVLADLSHVEPDPTLQNTPVTAPEIKANESWRQAGGAPAGMNGNLALSGLTHHDSARIGDHNGWEQPLYPGPVAASGVVYAMDAKGYITAHDARDIGKVLWTVKAAVTEDEADLLGGGLAVEGDRLYASSGRGALYALDARNGKLLWKQKLNVSFRAAPKASASKVYALSVDNQLFAFDAGSGKPLWSHRGPSESSGFIASATPAVGESMIVTPYSSGDIYAIDAASGQDVWSDTLLLSRHNSATGLFSGIGGNPVVKDDTVYAGGSSGFFAAIALANGRRVWERDISILNTPWIAGDYVYLLSSDNELACLLRSTGRVRWATQLQSYGNEKRHRDPLVWRGPIMAGGRLLVAGTHGRLLAFSPADGKQVETVDIPSDITDTPIVAGGRLYFLTQDARLHVLY